MNKKNIVVVIFSLILIVLLGTASITRADEIEIAGIVVHSFCMDGKPHTIIFKTGEAVAGLIISPGKITIEWTNLLGEVKQVSGQDLQLIGSCR